ncbi:unnamed protein product [Hydatigera taeniaeformis]|uniref:Uncharacterized protein n=1 Tax=Hydatigena taeniaeformis TaxID=6205 RepID=A0A0R3WL40_HYDTA|nr:unnamed protein product [Hydatigera taeniaeformis]
MKARESVATSEAMKPVVEQTALRLISVSTPASAVDSNHLVVSVGCCALASNAMDVGTNLNKDRIPPLTLQPFDSTFLSSAADFLISGGSEKPDKECGISCASQSLLCIAACLHGQLQRYARQALDCSQEKSLIGDEAEHVMSSWSDFFDKLQKMSSTEVEPLLNAKFNRKPKLLDLISAPTPRNFHTKVFSGHAPELNLLNKFYSQSEPDLHHSLERELQRRNLIRSLDCFLMCLLKYAGYHKEPSLFPLATLADQLSKLRLWLIDDTRRPFSSPTMAGASHPSTKFEISSTELYLRRLLNLRDTEVLYLLNNLPGGEKFINHSSKPNVFPSRDCTEAQLELMSNWDMVQPIDPSCLPVYRVKLPQLGEVSCTTTGHHSEAPAVEGLLSSPNDASMHLSPSPSEASQNSLTDESISEIKVLLRRCWILLKEMVSTIKRAPRLELLRTRADELLDASLRLSRFFNGETSASTEYAAIVDTVAHADFKRIPDSPGLPRNWSRAPIQELIWAIETLDDIEELRSLAHLLTQQYNAIGTTLEQQLNVNRDLRNRLREANNHLARIYLSISQGSQRLAVMTERLLIESQKHDEVDSTCDEVIPPKSYSQNPISADDIKACAQSGPSDLSTPATLPLSSQKAKGHGKMTLLHTFRQAMRPKSKK